MKHRLAVFTALLFVTLPAFAHGPLPSTAWCEHRRSFSIGEFHFSREQLQNYRSCLFSTPGGGGGGGNQVCMIIGAPVATKPCPAQTCGEFDDDYHVAQRMALNHCRKLDNRPLPDPSLPLDDSSVVPSFASPAVIWSTGHHALYDLDAIDSGIHGSCVRCAIGVRDNPTQ